MYSEVFKTDSFSGLQLKCCGIEGPKDWDRNVYFNCSSEAVGSREACGVPFSCCKQKANVSISGLGGQHLLPYALSHGKVPRICGPIFSLPDLAV